MSITNILYIYGYSNESKAVKLFSFLLTQHIYFSNSWKEVRLQSIKNNSGKRQLTYKLKIEIENLVEYKLSR